MPWQPCSLALWVLHRQTPVIFKMKLKLVNLQKQITPVLTIFKNHGFFLFFLSLCIQINLRQTAVGLF